MLEGMTPPKLVRTCLVRTVAATLSPKDAEIFMNAVADPDYWRAETLSKALAARGVVVSGKVIAKHRAKTCSCGQVDNA